MINISYNDKASHVWQLFRSLAFTFKIALYDIRLRTSGGFRFGCVGGPGECHGGAFAQTCKYKCSLWFFWVLFSNGKHCIWHYLHCSSRPIPLYQYYDSVIVTFKFQHINNSTFYLLLSICHLISITDTIGLRLTVTVYTLHYTCCC